MYKTKQEKINTTIKNQFEEDENSHMLCWLVESGSGVQYFDGCFKTGFRDLDNIIDLFLPGDLMVVTSKKSTGKTSLLLNFIANDIKYGYSLFFSTETTRVRVLEKLLKIYTKNNLRNEHLEIDKEVLQKKQDATTVIKNSHIVIEDSVSSIMNIESVIEGYIKKTGCVPVVFIDNLQMFNSNTKEGLYVLKNIAKKHKVPVVVTSIDLEVQETQTADVVLSLKEGDRGEENGNYVLVSVVKNRNGGRGIVRFSFNEDISKFYKIDSKVLL